MNSLQTREVSAAIAQLRAEIEQLPKNKGGKRRGISDDLKRRAAVTLAKSGMRAEEFGAAISVSVSAVSKWRRHFGGDEAVARKLKKIAPGSGFKKVSVLLEQLPPSKGLTIEGPNGMRITGLSAEDVAKLWRALC